jgi:hypothetical protein
LRWPSCAPVRSLTGGGNEHGDKRHLACPHSRACELGMKKAKALQLNPGQIITFGDHPYTAHCTRVWQGEVLHVTPRGGIKVKVSPTRSPGSGRRNTRAGTATTRSAGCRTITFSGNRPALPRACRDPSGADQPTNRYSRNCDASSGAQAIAPFVREHRTTYILTQGFEND